MRWLFTLSIMILAYANSTWAHPDNQPNIHSEAAILIDGQSGQVLYEKSARQQMYPASITKIVTGMIAIEEGDLNKTVKVSRDATEVMGTRVYLVEDEEVELNRLVQGLLINSGNDAGLVIAEHISGSEYLFSKKMNEFVQEKIGVFNTNFTNPHGLFNPNHYTTAYDMAKIAQYAMKNEQFREIVGTKELDWIGEGWQTTIYNHHRLLWDYEGVTGIKNGFVTQSGFTLTTSAQKNDMELIVVTLNAPTSQIAYDDTISLLNYGFENFQAVVVPTQTLEDGFGDQYILYKKMFVTTPKDSNIKKEVKDGTLLIKDDKGFVLAEQKLKKLWNEEFSEVNSNQHNEKENITSNWFNRIINFFKFFTLS